jgi:methionyl-tRNA formyltransferase
MQLVFMGTPEFAVPTLNALVAAGHRVRAVFTQPDKPAGRGGKLTAPPVKRAATGLGLEIHQPAKIRTPEVFALLQSLAPEAIIIVGYGKIIPQNIIDLPPYGCINLHASLLPKYRGAAPINWAIVRGETVTGVTTMKIDAGLDTGDILLMQETPIAPEEDAATLNPRLAEIGAQLVVETLVALERGAVTPVPQDHDRATLAPILKKEDGQIDWSLPPAGIVNRVRGFVPWPGAFTNFRGELLHVWKARVESEFAPPEGALLPGTISVAGKRLFVASGEDTLLELIEVQIEGRKRIQAADFINGAHIKSGEKLG